MQTARTRRLSLLKKLLPSRLYYWSYSCYRSIGMLLSLDYRNRQTFFDGKPLHMFEVDDCKMFIYLRRDNGYTANIIHKEKASEPDILRLIKSLLPKDGVFIDAGANIGQHSLFASHYCRHVYSFEPITFLYDQFQRSIRENNACSISAFNFALGSAAATVPIYSNSKNRGESSIAVSYKREILQEVKVVRLDDIYEQGGIVRVDVMKVDVEGSELEVLKGAEAIIERWHPAIILELSPYIYQHIDSGISRKILNFLYGKGYAVYDIEVGFKREEITSANADEFIKRTRQTNMLCVYKLS